MEKYDEKSCISDQKIKEDEDINETRSSFWKWLIIIAVSIISICILILKLCSNKQLVYYAAMILSYSFPFSLITLGIYFIAANIKNRKKQTSAAFWLLGIGIVSFTAVFLFRIGTEFARTLAFALIADGLMLIFLIIAVAYSLKEFNYYSMPKENCTQSIDAVCIRCEREKRRGNYIVILIQRYHPYYEYTFNGVKYKSRTGKTKEPHYINVVYPIYIDPVNPKNIYEPDIIEERLPVLIFKCFLAIAFPVFFIILFSILFFSI